MALGAVGKTALKQYLKPSVTRIPRSISPVFVEAQGDKARHQQRKQPQTPEAQNAHFALDTTLACIELWSGD